MPSTEPRGAERREARLAWWMTAPAVLTILLVALFPLGWTIWESFHLHDLRMPWLGRPFVGLANYREAAHDARFLEAVVHTVAFAATAVAIEIVLGLILALALDALGRGVGIVRTAVLLPWAVPTVVAALIWRFIFESPGGIASAVVAAVGHDGVPMMMAFRKAQRPAPGKGTGLRNGSPASRPFPARCGTHVLPQRVHQVAGARAEEHDQVALELPVLADQHPHAALVRQRMLEVIEEPAHALLGMEVLGQDFVERGQGPIDRVGIGAVRHHRDGLADDAVGLDDRIEGVRVCGHEEPSAR